MIMRIDRIRLLIAIAFIAGCTTYGAAQFEQRFGQASPRERVVESLPVGAVDYWSDVKPVLEQRCVVCHGCYDAPCQLKMSSIEGIERGATAEQVYKSSWLKAAPMTRLGEDADSVAEWREMGFSPVLNEYGDSLAANHEAGVMYQILGLKENNPLPDVRQLPDNFDLSLNRKQFCARPETFDKFAKNHPLWGMPYALPGLAREEQGTLMRWIEQGAEYTARAPIKLAFQSEIDRWEQFLNGDSLKQQLMSRYIFEHLVFGHLYFPDFDETTFFQMVRSAKPPGEPIEIIATRRPYDDPTVARVYYRIRHYPNSIVVKTHMPYRLDAARMQRWRSLFLDPAYDVGALPSYEKKAASNPFITFRDLPVNARYRFMLDESQFTIGSFFEIHGCASRRRGFFQTDQALAQICGADSRRSGCQGPDFARKFKRAAGSDSRPDLGRERQQSKCSADGLSQFRQRSCREGAARPAAKDGLANRLSRAGGNPLPARRRLRRIRKS
jgi:hypothetical protein